MNFSSLLAGGIAALMISTSSAFAGEIMVSDPYVRSATPSAKSGAAFLTLMNHGATDDVLIGASTEVAKRVELHTHREISDGVMQMVEIEGGIPVPAGGMAELKRGGMHIMMMGLNKALEQDTEITVTLTFENAGEMEVQVPVDHARKPKHGAMKMDHSKAGQGTDS